MMNNSQPRSSRSALKQLLAVLVVTIVFVIYSYGWTVTDIDLRKPQEAQRQENVGNTMRELLSPRLFQQDRDVIEISAPFLVDCSAKLEIPETTVFESGGVVTVDPTCGSDGDVVNITVSGFAPLADTRIRWIPPEGQSRPREDLITGREEIVLDSNGEFTGQIEVPRISGSQGQINQIAIRAAMPTGAVRLSDIAQQTIMRMTETIFMALIATSISIPIAGLISFFAARNLMRPIRLSVGNLLAAFLSFALGWWIGSTGLAQLGDMAVRIGNGETIGIVGVILPIIVLVIAFVLMRAINTRLFNADKSKSETLSARSSGDNVRAIINMLIITFTLILFIGSLAGFAIWFSDSLRTFGDSLRPEFLKALNISSEQFYPLNPLEWLQNAFADGVVAIGTLMNIIGTLIQLLMPIIAGLILGATLAGLTSTLASIPMRLLPESVGRILGAVLGALSGAILLAVMAQFGMNAALLGLLPPIIAAILAGELLLAVYRRVTPTPAIGQSRSPVRRGTMLIIYIVGAALAFVFTFNSLNVGRALIDGTLPATNTIQFLGIELFQYVMISALIGAVLGGVGGFVVGVHSNFPLGSTLYNIARTFLNAVRSIEPLIMALVFVVWVGIGPFAGVLALTLHSIASLGKLYSEQVENIDEGPVEAIRSTGANWLQMVIYSVVPQVVPPYIAFTMYRWDINVRMSTIIGFVGGGGIGLLLQQQINLLRYRDAGVAVLAIAIVVSVLDYASAYIRERLT